MGAPQTNVPGYDYFEARLKVRAGIDLSYYKERQMLRRLTGYLRRVGVDNFQQLADLIDRDDQALDALKNFLTINVTEFFRNPERFDDLKLRVLPQLIDEFGTLSIWSAGCSFGAEPYSISILLEELDPKGRHQVLATDIDRQALQQASEGVYGPETLRGVSPSRRRYFTQTSDGKWRIDDAIKARVRLRRHDLLTDPYPTGVHLIVCRNVVIYFTDDAKEKIFRGFSRSLVPGGYLLIGSTESIFSPGNYGLRQAGPFIYQRVEVGVP